MEELILDKLKQGDKQAIKYVFDKYYTLLCRFANHILNDMSISEEIADDVIFYLWEHRADIEITHALRAYLLRSVHNRCLAGWLCIHILRILLLFLIKNFLLISKKIITFTPSL